MPERAGDLRGPRQGGARDQEEAPRRCRSRSGSGSPRTSTRTWRCATSSGATAARSRTRTSNVVLNSPETLAALEYAKRLYSVGMTQAVLSWNAASNNQAFNAQETSYILNSISAYRTAQDNKLPVRGGLLLHAGAQGPHGHPAGVRARHERLRRLEVLQEPGRRQGVPGRPGRRLPRVDDGEQALQLPVVLRRGRRAQHPDEQEGRVGRGLDRQAVQQRPVRLQARRQAGLLAESFDRGRPTWATPATPTRPRARSSTPTCSPTCSPRRPPARCSPKDAMAEANTRAKEIFNKWRKKGMVAGGGKDK